MTTRSGTRKRKSVVRPGPPSAASRAVKERDEALRFQAATADILASLSRSRESPQPVLDAIVRNVLQLFDTRYAVVFLIKGEQLELAAVIGDDLFGAPSSEARRQFVQSFPQPIDWMSFTGQAMKAGEVRQLVPIAGNPKATPRAAALAKTFGYNSMVIAPLVRDGRAIGAIASNHREARRYSDEELAVLKTFADQAAIAIENARLFNETKEALERQKASADILRVIARSPGDIQPVLDAMAETAARLCGATDVVIRRLDGGRLHMAAHYGEVPITVDSHPSTRNTVMGRAVLERRTIHVADILSPEARAEFPQAPALARPVDYHTLLAVPLVRNDVAIGGILLRRLEVRLFSEQQVKLLESFADQAVIAIENARLFNETKEALERQTATAEILKVIASSPSDVQPVFNVIANSSRQLLGGMYANVVRREGDLLHLVAWTAMSEAAETALRNVFPAKLTGQGATGKAILACTPAWIVDVETDPDCSESFRERARARGFRSLLAVPMLRDGAAVGAINVTRAEPGAFSIHQIGLLQTFADQAVIAIENVRLFKELEARNKDLGESLEQQTATSEVLKVISRTQFDLEPVLNIVLDNALNLCGADRVIILRPNAEGNYVPAAGRTR
ncbi:MAG TPA: GAF domain-containing protein, partial [Burkholderiales bacterium]|nr:GAF domain-containing protein [Burkholderiales bacterium]